MYWFLRIILVVTITLIINGCNINDDKIVYKKQNQGNAQKKNDNVELILSEKTFPSNYDDVVFQRKEVPLHGYIVLKVTDKLNYINTSNLFKFNQEIAEVNFEDHHVFFIGVTESGSCPYLFEEINISIKRKNMYFELYEHDIPCTADATPRTFVFKVDKDVSDQINNVIIRQSKVETTIPLKE
ncbi:hypothetical protein ACFSCX_11505 [Bacillus salitolerans]|uniref:Lipoprotein n=1 Tax=Bacillus salitolerans TaxID=1437434 RepID=A0ABW4LQ64_9BACI